MGFRPGVLVSPAASVERGPLSEKVAPGLEALVFTGDKGGPFQRNNFNKRVGWAEYVKALGVPGLHFYDLRHTGNMLAASIGAGSDDPDGARQHACCADLPAQDGGSRSEDRLCDRGPDRRARARAQTRLGGGGRQRVWDVRESGLVARGSHGGRADTSTCRRPGSGYAPDLGLRCGAGDGNRTRMTSLEGWSSTIELRPQRPVGRRTKGNGSQAPIAAGHPASRSGRHPRVRARLGFTVSRDVAQFGSASALGAEGRGFESRHPDRAPDRAPDRRGPRCRGWLRSQSRGCRG